MLAILFAAIAPTISQLTAGSSSTNLVEICTVNGYKWIKVAELDRSKGAISTSHEVGHCAFCIIHDDSYALIGSPSSIVAHDVGRDTYPPLFYTAPFPLHTWTAAHPRAPPLVA